MIVHVAPSADTAAVERRLRALGLWFERLEDAAGIHYRIDEPSPDVDPSALRAIAGVVEVSAARSPHPLLDQHPATVDVAGVAIGPGNSTVIMAGPCGVESEEQVARIAAGVAAAGARFLRGGAYKPRTSPYAFQGHGEPALKWLRRAADAHGLRVVTECLATRTVDQVADAADLIQIGSRNMHNYDLLAAVGSAGKPVLLKRGMAATLKEWRLAAEYCLHHGAAGVVLCERGIRSFDPSTRGVLDLGAVAMLAEVDHLPVIADPSHAAGRRDLIPALARAAIAAGAAGLLLETHDDPGSALSDAPQAIAPEELERLLHALGVTPIAHHPASTVA